MQLMCKAIGVVHSQSAVKVFSSHKRNSLCTSLPNYWPWRVNRAPLQSLLHLPPPRPSCGPLIRLELINALICFN